MSAAQKAQCPGGAGQSAEETSDAPIIALAEKTGNPSDKDFATVTAQFALKGHALIRVANGYAAHKWGLFCYLPNWPAVLIILEQIGGSNG